MRVAKTKSTAATTTVAARSRRASMSGGIRRSAKCSNPEGSGASTPSRVSTQPASLVSVPMRVNGVAEPARAARSRPAAPAGTANSIS